MNIHHRWQDCRPVLYEYRPATSELRVADGRQDGLDMAWSLVPDDDRRLFHEYCCLDQKAPGTLAAVKRIRELMRTVFPGC